MQIYPSINDWQVEDHHLFIPYLCHMPLTPETKQEIFNKIKSLLAKCVPPMVLVKDNENVYELIGNKPAPYGSTKKMVPGMYFSSVVLRKDSINFYFFPIYYRTEEFKSLIPSLIKCLKGKTCFHFKKLDQVNEKEFQAMLKKGLQIWKENGYLN